MGGPSRRRREDGGRAASLAEPEAGFAGHDGGRRAHPGGDRAEGEPGGGVASDDEGVAA